MHSAQMNVFKVSCFLLLANESCASSLVSFVVIALKPKKIIMTEGCHSSMRLQQLRSHLYRHGLINDQLIFKTPSVL